MSGHGSSPPARPAAATPVTRRSLLRALALTPLAGWLPPPRKSRQSRYQAAYKSRQSLYQATYLATY